MYIRFLWGTCWPGSLLIVDVNYITHRKHCVEDKLYMLTLIICIKLDIITAILGTCIIYISICLYTNRCLKYRKGVMLVSFFLIRCKDMNIFTCEWGRSYVVGIPCKWRFVSVSIPEWRALSWTVGGSWYTWSWLYPVVRRRW